MTHDLDNSKPVKITCTLGDLRQLVAILDADLAHNAGRPWYTRWDGLVRQLEAPMLAEMHRQDATIGLLPFRDLVSIGVNQGNANQPTAIFVSPRATTIKR